MNKISNTKLVEWMDELLRPETFRDACPNGFQVVGKEEISTVVTCPSVSLELFEKSAESGADAILVHHGLFWDRDTRVIQKPMSQRLKILLNRELNLFAYHLPLDANREVGNNAKLADLAELNDRDWSFGLYHGMPIGVCGRLHEPRELGELASLLEKQLDANPVTFEFCRRPVSRLGIVSGGAGDISMVVECANKGCDALLTGEVFEQTVAVGRELGIGLIAGGHYNTEKLGVRALGDRMAEQLGIRVIHLDIPNPV